MHLYPIHVAQKLANNAIVSSGHLKLNDDVPAFGVHS